MTSLFLAPHYDDEALFGCYTIMREKPLVCVITAAHIQTNRGEVGCDDETRWKESKAAMKMLGVPLCKFGIPDFELLNREVELSNMLAKTFGDFDVVYVPALQGGNEHHDIVSRAATAAFKDKVKFYSTYAKGQWATPGKTEVVPTEEEKALKNKVLDCYQSQINLGATRGHFDAVRNKSEWFI